MIKHCGRWVGCINERFLFIYLFVLNCIPDLDCQICPWSSQNTTDGRKWSSCGRRLQMSIRHYGGWSRWKTDGGRMPEKSNREKKGREGRTEDESISKLLWSVTESRTGRWMPVGALSEQQSTFCCIQLYTSSALVRPPTARKHVWSAQWVL